jgi:hypothetical protein
MPENSVIWILSSVIGILLVILGFFLSFLFTKASAWGEEQKETNKQLALINQTLNYQKERSDKHETEISSIWDRLTVITDRLSFLWTSFELMRFSGCKEDCPVSDAIARVQEMANRESARAK